MTSQNSDEMTDASVKTIEDLAKLVDYSLMDSLNSDPQATTDGVDYRPRQVFSGHYVPVKPSPIKDPLYIAHSRQFFDELGFADALARDSGFRQVFSGDLSDVHDPMRKLGWATGYALSIYGTEYIEQCPFRTGNAYGDGRAVSVIEAVINGKRWEMQLKGGGQSPYCRGADGRAVLRSSVREFLAQEHMHALGVATSRSLCLFMSQSETVSRPWYSEGSMHPEPDIMVPNLVAISTRVAPSFLRVGQIELFGRRARKQEHPEALKELEMIVLHLIDREYQGEIDPELSVEEKAVELALLVRDRLTSLVTNWLRVGYCQGNFNSDNCAGGGFTLDYGPFGFMEMFEPYFQPWTGGGRHFSFLNQPAAAKLNFNMLCVALRPLLTENPEALEKLDGVLAGFATEMQGKLNQMWADKFGIKEFDADLFVNLMDLMVKTGVDYTIFFRELSEVPEDFAALSKSFYSEPSEDQAGEWQAWLNRWRDLIEQEDKVSLSRRMKQVNPKYTWREWLVVPAYEKASRGDFTLIHELQEVLTKPYHEQSEETESKYYRLKPQEFFGAGGVSHYSCSS